MRSWRNAPAVVPPGSLADDPIGKEALPPPTRTLFWIRPPLWPRPAQLLDRSDPKSGDLKQIPAGFQVVGV